MGNLLSSSPTKKMDMLVQEVNDFSANVSQNILAEASQTILIRQEQNIVISNSQFKNCNFEASQDASVIANQVATFKATLSSPKQLIKQLTEGPNSLLGQAFNSSSVVMKQFLESTKKSFNTYDDASIKGNFINIMKININQSVINRAVQTIMVDQKQNVLLSNFNCENSTITIKQNAAVNAMQNVLMTIAMDALSSNPKIRQAIRDFNGDYDPKRLDEPMDTSITLPQACSSDLVKLPRTTDCPPCETCPPCAFDYNKCPPPPPYDDFILSAKLFYSIICGATFLLFMILYRRMKS